MHPALCPWYIVRDSASMTGVCPIHAFIRKSRYKAKHPQTERDCYKEPPLFDSHAGNSLVLRYWPLADLQWSTDALGQRQQLRRILRPCDPLWALVTASPLDYLQAANLSSLPRLFSALAGLAEVELLVMVACNRLEVSLQTPCHD
jgi:hypothetical protein